MSGFYEKNMSVLRDRFIDIAEYIENKEYVPSEDLYIEEFDAQKKLIIKDVDRYLQISSLYDDDILTDLWVKKHMMENSLDKKHVMFGLGTGAFARKFLTDANQNSQLIVFEPDCKIFERVIREYDISDILKNDRFVFYLKPALKEKARFLFGQFLTYYDLFNISICCHPNYDLLYFDDYRDMCEELNAAGRSLDANQYFYEHFGVECNENVFDNIKYYINSKSLESIKNKMPKDFAAIIVAAGPSLDKNINELKKAKNKALIISTDTALRPLARAGIQPDIAVAVDPIKGEKYFSEEDSRSVPLVCGLQTSCKVLNSHNGIKIFKMEYSNHMKKFLDQEEIELPVISSGGSVANDAMSVALYLGAKTIILVGQDLAYTGDKTHSKTTVRGESFKETDGFEAETFDKDIYGNDIRTSYVFLLYRDWIEKVIREDTVGTNYVDATEGGIMIHGTEIMTLSDAINQYCKSEFDLGTCFEHIDDTFDEVQKKKLKAYYAQIPKEIEEMRLWVNKGIQTYDKMLELIIKDKYNSKEMVKLMQKSKDFSDMISDAPCNEFVFNIIQGNMNNVLKDVNNMKNSERDELLSVCNCGRDSLVEMKKGIEKALGQIEEAEFFCNS